VLDVAGLGQTAFALMTVLPRADDGLTVGANQITSTIKGQTGHQLERSVSMGL